MDFRFTPDETMAADQVRRVLDDTCRSADLRRLMQTGAARDEDRWTKLTGLGLQGMLVPEALGGLGLHARDFVQIAEACGTAGLPEPLVENVGVGLPLLAEFAGDARVAPHLAAALSGARTVTVGHPINPFVADADTADLAIIARDGALHLVAPAAAMIRRQTSIDPFRRLFTVTFADAPVLARGEVAQAALDRALDRGALFAAAQALGCAKRCVDLAVEYARQRHQFGKPIGAYQAVKHHLATAHVKIEFARPVLHAAAAALHTHDRHARSRISHAKLAAAEACDLAARTAIQVHGAMGYSWDVDVHLFLKRGLALSTWWGGATYHRERVAARVFGAPIGPEHGFAIETAPS